MAFCSLPFGELRKKTKVERLKKKFLPATKIGFIKILAIYLINLLFQIFNMK